MSDHPDFEALSASLDGEDELAAAHAATCSTCQAELAGIRSVREAVETPVRPPGPEVIDAAIARAVAAAGEWEQAGVGAAAGEWEQAGGDRPAAGVAKAGTGLRGPNSGTGLRGPNSGAVWPPPGRERRPGSPAQPVSGGRWRLWLTGSAAAAVVAIVVLTAVLVTGGSGGSGTRDDTALSAGPDAKRAQEAAPPGAATGSATGAAGAAPPNALGAESDVSVQELGDVADVSALRSRFSTRTVPLDPRAVAPATDAASPVPRVIGTRVCEIEARTARPHLGVVVYVANLRFQGTAAVALGFAPAPGASPVSLLVLAPAEGCRLLAETTIP